MRLHHFGRIDDLRVGALIEQLLAEKSMIADVANDVVKTESVAATGNCDSNTCAIR